MMLARCCLAGGDLPREDQLQDVQTHMSDDDRVAADQAGSATTSHSQTRAPGTPGALGPYRSTGSACRRMTAVLIATEVALPARPEMATATFVVVSDMTGHTRTARERLKIGRSAARPRPGGIEVR